MDAVTTTVLFGVGWFFLGSIVSALIWGAFILLGAATNMVGFVVLGWVLALVWEGWVVIQIIVHIINIIRLIAGGN